MWLQQILSFLFRKTDNRQTILVSSITKVGVVDYNNFVKYVEKYQYFQGILIAREQTEPSIKTVLQNKSVLIVENKKISDVLSELQKQFPEKKIEKIAVEDYSDRSLFYDAC